MNENEKAEPVDCVEVIRDESLLPSQKKKNWLAFWKHPSKRERQIMALQNGYAEMISLIRSIRQNLDQQTENQSMICQHLPDAVNGIKAMGDNAQQQTRILDLMQNQLDSTLEHDKQMISSFDRFNNTLSDMDATNRNTTSFMTELVERTQEAEDLVRTMLVRSHQRLLVLVVILLLTTLAVVGASVYHLM